MNTHLYFIDLLLCLLAILCISNLCQARIDRFHSKTAPKPKTPRPLKPKTADDCPFCRAEPVKTIDPQPKQALKPWSEVKSHRGRKKTLSTQGHSLCWLLDSSEQIIIAEV